ncbi:hypothetical protein QBC47DRAFT_415676 [Echria macrotheca]|uniref:Uncharacterized protein n=1 Tax=Echria macrotheca TaxID=438768 RepID=A0AAJ0F9A6_9PEZI|nr:hypothetical protein QBC47DRAFT_415676 [Echria macrotheca]
MEKSKVNGGDPNKRGPSLPLCLDKVISEGPDIAMFDMDRPTYHWWFCWFAVQATPLHFAARNGHFYAVQWLLQNQADPQIGSESWESWDDTVSSWRWRPILSALWNGHLKIMELLIASGASFDKHPDDPVQYEQRTALNIVALRGHVHLLDWIRRQPGCGDVTAVDGHGATPLFFAAVKWDNLDMLTRLTQLGAQSYTPAENPNASEAWWRATPRQDALTIALKYRNYPNALYLLLNGFCTGSSETYAYRIINAVSATDSIEALHRYPYCQQHQLPPTLYMSSGAQAADGMKLLRYVHGNKLINVDADGFGDRVFPVSNVVNAATVGYPYSFTMMGGWWYPREVHRQHYAAILPCLLELGASSNVVPDGIQNPIVDAFYSEGNVLPFDGNWELFPTTLSQLRRHYPSTPAKGRTSLTMELLRHSVDPPGTVQGDSIFLTRLCVTLEERLGSLVLDYIPVKRGAYDELVQEQDILLNLMACRAGIETINNVLSVARARPLLPAEGLAKYQSLSVEYEKLMDLQLARLFLIVLPYSRSCDKYMRSEDSDKMALFRWATAGTRLLHVTTFSPFYRGTGPWTGPFYGRTRPLYGSTWPDTVR